MKRVVILICAAVSPSCAVFGVAYGPDTAALRARASFDMQCPESQLELKELESGTTVQGGTGAVFGVTGCEKRSTYVQTSPLGKTWVLNSDTEKSKKKE